MQEKPKKREKYGDLYQDLPQEVQDVLIQSHPFMEEERTVQKSARTPRGDVEQVREARMQQIATELEQMKHAPVQEDVPTRYAIRKELSMETEKKDKKTNHSSKQCEQKTDTTDIEYVSVMPSRKKAGTTEKKSPKTSKSSDVKSQKTLFRREKEEMPFTDLERMGGRPRYEEWAFEDIPIQEELQDIYYDEYDDEKFTRMGKLQVFVGIIGLILIIFLIFHSVSLRSQLQEVKAQIETVDDLQKRYEEVQLEKMQLQEQLDKLQNPNAQQSETASTETTGDTETYTVQEGETAWSIAQKVYGNGASYKKILEANGLSENSSLQPGDVLKIPAA